MKTNFRGKIETREQADGLAQMVSFTPCTRGGSLFEFDPKRPNARRLATWFCFLPRVQDSINFETTNKAVTGIVPC
jgi:hypothetical protein